jgi:hypothetical protein
MEALLRFLLATAKRQVDDHGGFHPFGASMALDGEVALLATRAGDGDAQLAGLLADAAARAGELLAVGICTDVALAAGGTWPEAIRVDLEHRGAPPETCLVGYRNTDEELTFADPQWVPGERRTWR